MKEGRQTLDGDKQTKTMSQDLKLKIIKTLKM